MESFSPVDEHGVTGTPLCGSQANRPKEWECLSHSLHRLVRSFFTVEGFSQWGGWLHRLVRCTSSALAMHSEGYGKDHARECPRAASPVAKPSDRSLIEFAASSGQNDFNRTSNTCMRIERDAKQTASLYPSVACVQRVSRLWCHDQVFFGKLGPMRYLAQIRRRASSGGHGESRKPYDEKNAQRFHLTRPDFRVAGQRATMEWTGKPRHGQSPKGKRVARVHQ